MIRERRKSRDGTTVWDANVSFTAADGRKSSLHLGTFEHYADAQAVVDEWHASAVRDKEILRERAANEQRSLMRAAHMGVAEDFCAACDEYRWHMVGVRYVDWRPRRAAEWPEDPTGDTAAARVDRERGAA